MVQGHIDALVDEDGADDLLKALPGVHPQLPPQGPPGGGGQLQGEGILLGCLLKGGLGHQAQQGGVVQLVQAAQHVPVAPQLPEGRQHPLLGGILKAGDVQGQHPDEGADGARVVGPLHIGPQIGQDLPLEKLQRALPAAGSQAVFQLRRQLGQVPPPAFGQVVLNLAQIALEVLRDVGQGGVVHVFLRKAQNGPPGPLVGHLLIGLAQQVKEGAAEAALSLQLVGQKPQQGLPVHAQHAQQGGHFLGNARGQPGGRHRRAQQDHDPAEHLGQVGGLPQLAQKGLEVGVVPQGPGLQGVIRPLPLGLGVRPCHPGGVDHVLDPGVGLGSGDGGAVILHAFIAGDPVGRAQQISHRVSSPDFRLILVVEGNFPKNPGLFLHPVLIFW